MSAGTDLEEEGAVDLVLLGAEDGSQVLRHCCSSRWGGANQAKKQKGGSSFPDVGRCSSPANTRRFTEVTTKEIGDLDGGQVRLSSTSFPRLSFADTANDDNDETTLLFFCRIARP